MRGVGYRVAVVVAAAVWVCRPAAGAWHSEAWSQARITESVETQVWECVAGGFGKVEMVFCGQPAGGSPSCSVLSGVLANGAELRALDVMNAMRERDWAFKGSREAPACFWRWGNQLVVPGVGGGEWDNCVQAKAYMVADLEQQDWLAVEPTWFAGREEAARLDGEAYWDVDEALVEVVAPGNFFDYTPVRDLVGIGIGRTRVETCSWVIRTSETGVVTLAVLDSAGNAQTISGTNLQTVYSMATNLNIEEGWDSTYYGWQPVRDLAGLMECQAGLAQQVGANGAAAGSVAWVGEGEGETWSEAQANAEGAWHEVTNAAGATAWSVYSEGSVTVEPDGTTNFYAKVYRSDGLRLWIPSTIGHPLRDGGPTAIIDMTGLVFVTAIGALAGDEWSANGYSFSEDTWWVADEWTDSYVGDGKVESDVYGQGSSIPAWCAEPTPGDPDLSFRRKGFVAGDPANNRAMAVACPEFEY